MANDMFNLLVVKGSNAAIKSFQQQTAHAFIFGFYKEFEFYVENLNVRAALDEMFAISFCTAWHPPYGVLEQMSVDHPDLLIELTYEEEQVRYYKGFCNQLSEKVLIEYCGTAIFCSGECASHESGDHWGQVLNIIKNMESESDDVLFKDKPKGLIPPINGARLMPNLVNLWGEFYSDLQYRKWDELCE